MSTQHSPPAPELKPFNAAPQEVPPNPPHAPASDASSIRRAIDRSYELVVKATAALDETPPRQQPTESQKFRANVLLTLMGSLLLGVIVWMVEQHFTNVAIERTVERTHAHERLQARNNAIKHFTEKFPRAALLSYQMSREGILWHQRPADVQLDEICCDGRTWREVRDSFYQLRVDLTTWGDASGPCLTLAAYLKPNARNAVNALHNAVREMIDENDIAEVDKDFATVNELWDKAVMAIAEEQSE